MHTTEVDLGGHFVTSEVFHGGQPPVVLVNAQGTAKSQWEATLRLLTTKPTVVTYDRPGIGDSPPRPAPNPPLPYSAFAAELTTMLDQIGMTEPVVLVGHSFGSLIVRMFAARHPDRVAGMVHVDGSVPRLALWPGSGSSTDGDGPGATEIDAVAGEVEISRITWPTRPGIVLARTPGRWGGVALPDPGIDGFWQRSQAELARLTSAVLIAAADAGHEIPREAPRLVAFAIDEVVSAARVGCSVVQPHRDLVVKAGGR